MYLSHNINEASYVEQEFGFTSCCCSCLDCSVKSRRMMCPMICLSRVGRAARPSSTPPARICSKPPEFFRKCFAFNVNLQSIRTGWVLQKGDEKETIIARNTLSRTEKSQEKKDFYDLTKQCNRSQACSILRPLNQSLCQKHYLILCEYHKVIRKKRNSCHFDGN